MSVLAFWPKVGHKLYADYSNSPHPTLNVPFIGQIGQNCILFLALAFESSIQAQGEMIFPLAVSHHDKQPFYEGNQMSIYTICKVGQLQNSSL